MTSRFLGEIPEADAVGAIGDVYADIRRVVGSPLVNLVYRHLATFPGVLEAVWRELGPNLETVSVGAATLRAGVQAKPAAAIPMTALLAVDVDAGDLERVHATLAAYARANAHNLVGVLSLLEGARGGGNPQGAPRARPSAPVGRTLPLGDLSRVRPAVLALLEEMGTTVAGGGEAIFVPSLFRHFAHRPGLLALFWTVIRGPIADGALDRDAAAVGRRARELVAALPFPVTPLPDGEPRRALERFRRAIPRMVVVESVLSRSLPAPNPSEPITP